MITTQLNLNLTLIYKPIKIKSYEKDSKNFDDVGILVLCSLM